MMLILVLDGIFFNMNLPRNKVSAHDKGSKVAQKGFKLQL